jgi:hypothetical protein
MKTIIAGGRDFTDYTLLQKEANRLDIDIVVCGMAKGADSLGLKYAQEYKIGLKKFPADWDQYGKRAGPIRNCQMGDYADNLLAFWDGKSSGTAHMINYMRKLNKPVIIVSY